VTDHPNAGTPTFLKTIRQPTQAFSVAVYLIAGIALIPFFRYQVNTDGISYLSIAEKYLQGNFRDAVNGYWAPLLSWLLAPALIIVRDRFLAMRIVSLFIGLFTLIVFMHAARVFRLKGWIRRAISLAVIPPILYYANIQFTSDLLLAGMFLLYVTLVMDSRYLEDPRRAALVGMSAAFCYFAKHYALPLLILHLTVASLAHLSLKPITKVFRNFGISFMLFLCVSSCWVGVLSIRYGQLTISTAGAYNMASIGPSRPPYPMDKGRLVPPPNQTARSIWEEPSQAGYPPAWSPLKSTKSFIYEIRLCLTNLWLIVRYLHDFTIFASMIVAGYVVLLFKRRQSWIVQPLLALLIYPAGYVLVRVEPRYLWPMSMIMFLMAGYLLSIVTRKRSFVAIVILSFVALPTLHLARARNLNADIHATSLQLHDAGVSGKLASNGNWNGTLYLTEYLDCSYYGYTDERSMTDLDQQLKKYGIDYFIAWETISPTLRDYLSQYPVAATLKEPKLKAFKLH